MFQDRILLNESIMVIVEIVYPTIFHLISSSMDVRQEIMVDFSLSLSPWGWLRFLSLEYHKIELQAEALSLKGVYIGFLVGLSDLSSNWAWVT